MNKQSIESIEQFKTALVFDEGTINAALFQDGMHCMAPSQAPNIVIETRKKDESTYNLDFAS